MLHHIIVKFNELVTDRADFLKQAQAVFAPVKTIPGVHGIYYHPAIITGSNRYDLMIVIDMDRDALPLYDSSEAHKAWKRDYGKYIESKAIFDCDARVK